MSARQRNRSSRQIVTYLRSISSNGPINIGATKEGKIVVFIGGEGQSVTTHTVKLTLQRV